MIPTDTRTINLSDVVARLDVPPPPISAPILALAPLLNPARLVLVAAALVSATVLQNRTLAIGLAVSAGLTFLIQSIPGLPALLRPASTWKALERLRPRLSPEIHDRVDAILEAVHEIRTREALSASAYARHKPDVQPVLVATLLYSWPLGVLATLFLLRPAHPSIALLGACGLFVLISVGGYYVLLTADPGARNRAARIDAIFHWRSQHVRHALYLTLGAALLPAAGYLITRLHDPANNIDLLYYPAAIAYPMLITWFRDQPSYTAEDAMRFDGNRPSIFLRSFEDDNVYVPSADVLSPGMHRMAQIRLETLLREKLGRLGPFIAVGDPRKGDVKVVGAARTYLPDDRWQDVVTAWMNDSQTIVMTAFRTASTKWELQHIVASGLLSRLILVTPPVLWGDPATRTARWSAVLDGFAGAPELAALSRLQIDEVRAIVLIDGRVITLCCDVWSFTTYELVFTLALYLVLNAQDPNAPPSVLERL